MECASRGLAFYSYQASQEVIYQEHLAKSLTEKYANLSQGMDQLIHEANAQIKSLQDKLQAMREEQESLEQKNQELLGAFRDKCKAQQQIQKLYQSLKAQVMASQVVNAAGDEADFALNSVRVDRFVDRIPGARSGNATLGQLAANQQSEARQHIRAGSGSSGNGTQQRSGLANGPPWHSHLQTRGYGSAMHTGTAMSAGTPRFAQETRNQLPVLGGARQEAFVNSASGRSYHASPMLRQPAGGGIGSRDMGFGVSGQKSRKRGADQARTLGR